MTPPHSKTATKSNAPRKPAPQQRPSSPRLVIHRLELTPEGRRQNLAIADHFGMTQIASLSRLIE